MAMKSPIRFRGESAGPIIHGYPATVLPELADAILEAEVQGAAKKRQKPIIDRARAITRGLANAMIEHLVDAQTGYVEYRKESAQAMFLRHFADLPRSWQKEFADRFYEEVRRLKGWPKPEVPHQRSHAYARITTDVIYDRLGPGVRDELERRNPRRKDGSLTYRHHQWLSRDLGHPKFREHFAAVVLLMESFGDSGWKEFIWSGEPDLSEPHLLGELERFRDHVYGGDFSSGGYSWLDNLQERAEELVKDGLLIGHEFRQGPKAHTTYSLSHEGRTRLYELRASASRDRRLKIAVTALLVALVVDAVALYFVACD